jgi:hypothetical protein
VAPSVFLPTSRSLLVCSFQQINGQPHCGTDPCPIKPQAYTFHHAQVTAISGHNKACLCLSAGGRHAAMHQARYARKDWLVTTRWALPHVHNCRPKGHHLTGKVLNMQPLWSRFASHAGTRCLRFAAREPSALTRLAASAPHVTGTTVYRADQQAAHPAPQLQRVRREQRSRVRKLAQNCPIEVFCAWHCHVRLLVEQSHAFSLDNMQGERGRQWL